jgi:hypothetical protein
MKLPAGARSFGQGASAETVVAKKNIHPEVDVCISIF